MSSTAAALMPKVASGSRVADAFGPGEVAALGSAGRELPSFEDIRAGPVQLDRASGAREIQIPRPSSAIPCAPGDSLGQALRDLLDRGAGVAGLVEAVLA